MPAVSVLKMAYSYIFDKKSILTAASYLNGEYGIEGLYVGVPVIIGSSGVEATIELELSNKEKAMFTKSVDDVKAFVRRLDDLKK